LWVQERQFEALECQIEVTEWRSGLLQLNLTTGYKCITGTNCTSTSTATTVFVYPDITSHIGDKSFQAINCTGTDNQTRNRQKKIHKDEA